MLDYDTIETLHIEVTDKCNASCPQCARNQSGGKVNSHLPLVELSLNDIKKIVPVELIHRLKMALFCGNFGDPIVAKETLEILEYFREINPNINLSINTNGSARDVSWWTRLGEVIQNKGNIKFGIDGLADTHALYRKGTDFHKIIRNAEAFIKAGGNAHWDFIVFRHNEHQVEEARALAAQLGFKKFIVKKTGRFFSNSKLEKKEHQDVLDEQNRPIYKIQPPVNSEFHNSSLAREEGLIKQFGSMQSYLEMTDISCKSLNEKSLYVSSEGLIFPCCWTANQMYVWYVPAASTPLHKLLDSHGGPETINAKFNSLESILENPFFKSIQASWSCKSMSEGKLQVCAKTCGSSFDQFKDQYL